jgi:hypothetical protein
MQVENPHTNTDTTRSCRLSTPLEERETDRHGRAHKLFFDHAVAWIAPDNKPLLCYTVKQFLYIRPVLAVWRRTASRTGALATGGPQLAVLNQARRSLSTLRLCAVILWTCFLFVLWLLLLKSAQAKRLNHTKVLSWNCVVVFYVKLFSF